MVPPLGLQSTEGKWGHICWDCWRLVYILLNMFYLLILWWRSVTGTFLHISSVVEEALRAPVCLLRVGGCGWVSVYVLTWTWIRKATGRARFQWFGPRARFELCERAQGLLLVLKFKRNGRGREVEEWYINKSSNIDENIYIDLQNCLWRVIVGKDDKITKRDWVQSHLSISLSIYLSVCLWQKHQQENCLSAIFGHALLIVVSNINCRD